MRPSGLSCRCQSRPAEAQREGLISSLRAPLHAGGSGQPPTPVTTPALLALPFLPTVKLCAHHCGSHGRCTPPPPVMSSTPSAYPAVAGALLWIQPANQSSLDLFSSQSHALSNLLAWLPLRCSSPPATSPPQGGRLLQQHQSSAFRMAALPSCLHAF